MSCFRRPAFLVASAALGGLCASAAGDPFPEFVDAAKRAGLDFTLLSGSLEKPFLPESMSGGVGLFDFDNDGLLDVYLVNGSTLEAERRGNNAASNRLFRNLGGGRFLDVTEKAGVGDTGWGMGVAAADVDNDGWTDLYVTNWGPNRLYMNNGDGTFRDSSRSSGASDPSWSSSAAFADCDGDSDLDLYVSNYVNFDLKNPPTEGANCTYRGLRVQCGPRGLPAQPDRFYENLGDGLFVDRTQESGMGSVTPHYGLGVVWGDYDDDGDPDLFVANDSTPNFLFRNDGACRFSEVALAAGVAYNEDGKAQAGMGVQFADYDNDGDLDLFVTNFSDDSNTLYRNEGKGFFSDATFQVGLGGASWQKLGWGLSFSDLDLDGWLDLTVANGHVYPEVDRQQIGTSFRQPNQVFRNLKGERFEEVTARAGAAFQRELNSRGLAAGDIDNNGRIDFLIANLDGSPSLPLNQGVGGSWLILKLRGTVSNLDALGARVVLTSGNLTQTREVAGGGSYQSQSDLRLHFGLAGAVQADRIQIRWPSGLKQVLEKVPANRILTIEEPRGEGAGAGEARGQAATRSELE